MKKFSRKRFRRSTRRGFKRLKSATKGYVLKEIHKLSETKYYDKIDQATAVDFAGTNLTLLTDVTQGTSDLQRVGDKLTIRGMRIRFTFSVADNYNIIRMILFQWIPSNNLLGPVPGYVLSATYLSTSRATEAPYTHDYKSQMIILWDKTINLALNQSNQAKYINKKVKLKFAKKRINFVAGTTAASNHIFLLLVSDSGAVPHPGVSFVSRLWYDDM